MQTSRPPLAASFEAQTDGEDFFSSLLARGARFGGNELRTTRGRGTRVRAPYKARETKSHDGSQRHMEGHRLVAAAVRAEAGRTAPG